MDESNGRENRGGGGIVFDFDVPMEGYLRVVLRSVDQKKRAATIEIVEGARGLQTVGCTSRRIREAERAAPRANERPRAGRFVARNACGSRGLRLCFRGRGKGGTQFGQPPARAAAAPGALYKNNS